MCSYGLLATFRGVSNVVIMMINKDGTPDRY